MLISIVWKCFTFHSQFEMNPKSMSMWVLKYVSLCTLHITQTNNKHIIIILSLRSFQMALRKQWEAVIGKRKRRGK